MPHQFDLLPIELQASVAELRSAGVSSDMIESLIERTLGALAVKKNQVQVEVWQIGVDLRAQVEAIGNKLDHDVQTKLGATNGMLADLHKGMREAGQGIAEIKKQFSELDQWRSRVEAALTSLSEFRTESTGDRQQIRDAVSAQDKRHEGQIDDLIKEFRAFGLRLEAIEQLLEIAGQHEAGS